MATDIQQTPFIKQLAANDRPTRDAALHSLRAFLSAKRSLPDLELLKLWKGLFYCLWMSDRPKPQAALAQELANLVSVLPSPSEKIAFLNAFWKTMQREWTNIDVLRMEKFLLVVRRYLAATFEVMRDEGWEEGVVGEVIKTLEGCPCEVEDVRVPNGLRFHVIDIYVDELERVTVLEEGSEAPVEVLLEPLRKLAKGSPNKVVRTKAKEALADERLPGNKKIETEEKGDEDGWGGIQD
ncbi:related to RRP1 protein [Phialocephala subalpina]|uniref:Related to RRP1 protein n=1 Tax=Phialocephala subalpina TaxID=576137 RepID=A0A1L7XAF1_9HELO|nr:related to RRP1 protein [Phialocephala subalpina]